MNPKTESQKIKQILSDEKFVYKGKVYTADLMAIVADKKNKALEGKPVTFMMLHGFTEFGEKVSCWSHDARVAPPVEVTEPVVEETPEPVVEETPEGGFPDEDDISEVVPEKPKAKKPKKAKKE